MVFEHYGFDHMKGKLFTILCILAPMWLAAQITLPPFVGDNMVIQRDEPIHFWGKGSPNTQVKVQFDGETKKTMIANDSTWSIHFTKRKADNTPQAVYISHGNEKVVLKNVLVGDVWLCIGQSNMEWPMVKEMHFKEEQQHANQPLLRFYNPTYAGKNVYNKIFGDSILKRLNANDFYQGIWQKCDSNSVANMSAVGYYFGKKIIEPKTIPIGLINLAIGGAPIETFISRKSLENNSQFSKKVLGNWLTNDELPVWVRERGKQNVGFMKNAPRDDLGPNHAFKPGFAYAAGIEPLTSMPIKGIVWYQGESNAQESERVKEYGELQKLMIQEYRKQWKQRKLPFFWVQLSTIDTANYKSHYWPEFRNEQRKLLGEIPCAGMVVTSDIGAKNDVHPGNKKDVGERLARWASKEVYRHKIVPSGPLPDKAVFGKGKVTVTYQYGNGLTTKDGKAVRGFSLDGRNHVKVQIDDDRIVIPVLGKPEFVYYAWQPWTSANLVNSSNLPASTFKIKIE